MYVVISKLILNYILLHVIFHSRCNLVRFVPKSILLRNSIDPVYFATLHENDRVQLFTPQIPNVGPHFE